nr:DUF4255 domain-containing protein [uncultured Sphingomonas sp.]
MSAHLALPATTTVLRQIIAAQLATPYKNMTVPTVHAGPPPRPGVGNGGGNAPAEETALYLYLHHVAASPAWRNMLDPSVGGDGVRQVRPPLAIDLHYMLAATGANLDREALLGLGMTALHRNPVVNKAKIAAVLAAIAPPQHPTAVHDLVSKEKLGDPASQPESLTITLQTLDVDLSTKLWSAIQAPLRPCAYYLVTTVFLVSDAPLPDGKPVKVVHVEADAAAMRDEADSPDPRPILSPVP